MPRLDPSFDPVAAANAGPDYYGPRWSLHYGRPPDSRWLENPRTEEWFLSIANNPAIDPGATLASWENTFRTEAARLGVRLDLTSANTILAFARLQTGQTSWQEIANSGSSVQPSGPGALPAPFVDVVAARQDAAIRDIVSRIDPNNYNGDDAAIAAGLAASGANFTAGLAGPMNVTPIPMPTDARISGASAGSNAAGTTVLTYPQNAADTQGRNTGVTGGFYDAPAGGFDMRLLVYAALAFVAYKALSKG